MGRSATLPNPPLWTYFSALLDRLPSLDWLILLLLDYYPDLQGATAGPVTHDLARRGLGRRGHLPIPPDIWSDCVPPDLVTLLQTFPGPGEPLVGRTSGPAATMLAALRWDGFLVPSPVHAPANAAVFLRPKTAVKAAFIADLRRVNALCTTPCPDFKLPALLDIGGLIASFPPGTLWGTSLDLTNFFWSLALPQDAVGAFRVGGLCWPCLPFEWNRSAVIAQRTLGRLLDVALAGPECLWTLWKDVFYFHYYDDVLILTTAYQLTSDVTSRVTRYFHDQGLVLSEKSVLVPTQTLTWLGKHLNMVDKTLGSTNTVLLHLLGLCVLTACVPSHTKLMDRVLGYALWAFRPHPGATLSLASWYRARHSGRRFWPRLPVGMVRGLADCFCLSLRPWRAERDVPAPCTTPVLCGDAPALGTQFRVGLFGPMVGARFLLCPGDVVSQQEAELYALDAATRLAVRLGWSHLTYVGDNSAALHVVRTMRPYLRNERYVRLVRRIRNRLLWSGLTVALIWVPSCLQPADPLSRCPLTAPGMQRGTLDCMHLWETLLGNMGNRLKDGPVPTNPP